MKKAHVTMTTRTHIEYDLADLRRLLKIPKEARDLSIEQDFDTLRVYYEVTTYPSDKEER